MLQAILMMLEARPAPTTRPACGTRRTRGPDFDRAIAIGAFLLYLLVRERRACRDRGFIAAAAGNQQRYRGEHGNPDRRPRLDPLRQPPSPADADGSGILENNGIIAHTVTRRMFFRADPRLVRPVPAGPTAARVRCRPARATSGGRGGARSRPGRAATAASGRRGRSRRASTIARISSRENQRASAISSGSTVISSVSASHRKPDHQARRKRPGLTRPGTARGRP